MKGRKMCPMDRGAEFEERVGERLERLRSQYSEYAEVDPQFPVKLASGRKVFIDFKLSVKFAHENQSYYFELQSRDRHGHELSDKIEAIRRDTPLSTFSFVHESPLETRVANELESRNVPCYDWVGFVHFTDGIELQLLQLRRAEEEAAGRVPRGDSRLSELVRRLAESQVNKKTRELRRSKASAEEGKLVEEIIKEVTRNPREAIRQARQFFKF